MTSIVIQSENLNRDGLQQQIARLLRRQVTSAHQSGSRLPNEHDLSNRYGVSVRTIREAVGTLVHDGLLERRHGSGTYVADLRKIRYIGVLVGQGLAGSFPYRPTLHIAQRLLDWLADHGLRGEVYAGHGNERSPYHSAPFEAAELVNDLDRGLVSALVSISANPHRSWYDLARTLDVPVMSMNPSFDYSAGIDQVGSLRGLFTNVAQLGRNNLAVAAWCEENLPGCALSRDLILKLACESGCTLKPGNLITDEHPGKPGAGWRVVEHFMTQTRKPDAMVFTDDHYYRDAAMALLARRIDVPRQLHVSTLLNKGQNNFLPFPTDVMEMDPGAVAAILGQMLIDKLENREVKRTHHLVPGTLLLNQCSL